jgi:hypothetical protein
VNDEGASAPRQKARRRTRRMAASDDLLVEVEGVATAADILPSVMTLVEGKVDTAEAARHFDRMSSPYVSHGTRPVPKFVSPDAASPKGVVSMEELTGMMLEKARPSGQQPLSPTTSQARGARQAQVFAVL